jgi:hypothetical protein
MLSTDDFHESHLQASIHHNSSAHSSSDRPERSSSCLVAACRVVGAFTPIKLIVVFKVNGFLLLAIPAN